MEKKVSSKQVREAYEDWEDKSPVGRIHTGLTDELDMALDCSREFVVARYSNDLSRIGSQMDTFETLGCGLYDIIEFEIVALNDEDRDMLRTYATKAILVSDEYINKYKASYTKKIFHAEIFMIALSSMDDLDIYTMSNCRMEKSMYLAKIITIITLCMKRYGKIATGAAIAKLVAHMSDVSRKIIWAEGNGVIDRDERKIELLEDDIIDKKRKIKELEQKIKEIERER